MARQENHRQALQQLLVFELFKQRQTTHARHAHIQKQATGLLGLPGLLVDLQKLDERIRTLKRLARQSARAQQPRQRLTHTRVVIDDKNQSIFCGLHR